MGEIMKGNPKKSALELDVDLIAKLAKPGSVILTRKKTMSSIGIQLVQVSKWSHVLMCLDKGDIIETDSSENIKIKPIGDALKGVDEIRLMVPENPITDLSLLRSAAESLANSANGSDKFGKTSLATSGILPITSNISWTMTGSLLAATTVGLASAPAAVLVAMAVGSGLIRKVDKAFGTRNQLIERMERFYKAVGIRESLVERLSVEDQRLICSTLVQELFEHSDPALKNTLDKRSIHSRPKDIGNAVEKSERYKITDFKSNDMNSIFKQTFKYNADLEQIELGNTGKVVAKKDVSIVNMFNPHVDSTLSPDIALHVLKGLDRVHEIRFSPGEGAAKLLTDMDFSEPLKQEFNHDTHTLEFSEYSETIRIAETNTMMMKRQTLTAENEWVFDVGGQIPEAMLEDAYLKFYANPELKDLPGEELLKVLTESEAAVLDDNYEPMTP
ncbi:MAG: hypothetical protein ACI9C9_002512 [Marivirga sp.]|jgi:hypothetical protein